MYHLYLFYLKASHKLLYGFETLSLAILRAIVYDQEKIFVNREFLQHLFG